PLRDQPDVLLIDEGETYRLIEAEIRAMRNSMRTDRIHIGMDEAHGVGLGEYLLRHGQTDRFDLLSRHLTRVVGICEKYGFRPMMWSDMFFRLGSPTNEYYDGTTVVPQRVIDSLPPVDMVYWDYYHEDGAFYDHMLAQHARMGKHTVFAGGAWTWSGFLPHVKRTQATMRPALAACARHRVQTVIATMWGDDAAETDVFLALGLLPIFSEACWQGEGCQQEEIDLAGACVSGLPGGALSAMGEFYRDAGELAAGKGLIWSDLLYPLLQVQGSALDAELARMKKAQQVLAALNEKEENPELAYAVCVFETALAKGEAVREIRARYLARDKAWLGEFAQSGIPSLMRQYDALLAAHRALWERDLKRFGWEIICLRYGSMQGRLFDVQRVILRYLAGEIDRIEELEETPLDPARSVQWYQTAISPSAGMGVGMRFPI
ncbi:MAG: hypothetical protein Q4A66_13375, partial [Eubacteriales bacterium]|nr:hypothetical protein [Eubacteriales bacterium]